MQNLGWLEEYDVGVQKFNEQHMQLLTALKDIYKAMEDKQDKKALQSVLNNLLKYCREHLAEEEACLLENDYPDFLEHKKQHNFFINKMLQFCEDFKDEKFTLHFDIAMFLKNWIIQHIMVVDKKYTKFLNSKGIH